MPVPLLWLSDNAAFPELIENTCYQKNKPNQPNENTPQTKSEKNNQTPKCKWKQPLVTKKSSDV